MVVVNTLQYLEHFCETNPKFYAWNQVLKASREPLFFVRVPESPNVVFRAFRCYFLNLLNAKHV